MYKLVIVVEVFSFDGRQYKLTLMMSAASDGDE